MANCKVQLKNSITSSCPSEEKTKHSFRTKEKNPLQTFLKKTVLQKVLFFFWPPSKIFYYLTGIFHVK